MACAGILRHVLQIPCERSPQYSLKPLLLILRHIDEIERTRQSLGHDNDRFNPSLGSRYET